MCADWVIYLYQYLILYRDCCYYFLYPVKDAFRFGDIKHI